jgi:prepilin-type processing-associated H-X9-DG protein
VEICPSLDYHFAQFKLKATGAAWGYGYNLHLSAPASQPPVNVTRIRNPSQVALLADAAQVNTFQPPASPDHPMLEEFYYISAGEPTVHFRHSRRAVAVFCDTHVQALSPEPESLDLRLPSQWIGRINSNFLQP